MREVGRQPHILPKCRERWEIVLAGKGGQGLALAGWLLSEAAGTYGGRYTTQIDIHGISVRGGESRSEIVVGDEEIDFPAVTAPDIVLAMTFQDLKRLVPQSKDDAIIILDADESADELPFDTGKRTFYRLALTSTARDVVGWEASVNVVALGALGAISGVVTFEALEKAVAARFTAGTRQTNLLALRAGRRLVEDVGVRHGHLLGQRLVS